MTPTASDVDATPPPPTCDIPSGSTFAIGTTQVTCTATDPDDANSPVSATFNVTVTDGPLDHLLLSPPNTRVTAGTAQAYTAEGFDAYGHDLGDVTSATTFTMSPDGSCTAARCTATSAGYHTVTGEDGTATGITSLTVTAGLVFTGVAPTRVCDTRPLSVSGTSDGCTGLSLQGGVPLVVDLPSSVVPAGAGAVVANVTVTGPSGVGYL